MILAKNQGEKNAARSVNARASLQSSKLNISV